MDATRRVNSDLLHLANPKTGDTWCDGISPRVLVLEVLPSGNVVIVRSRAKMSLDGLIYDFDLRDAKEVSQLEIVREVSTEIGGRKYLFSLDTTLTKPPIKTIFLIADWIEKGKIYKRLNDTSETATLDYYSASDWRFYVPTEIMLRYDSYTVSEQVLIQEIAEHAKHLVSS